MGPILSHVMQNRRVRTLVIIILKRSYSGFIYIEHFELQHSEFNLLLDKLMNVNLHNMNETEIIDFSEISSLIQNLIAEKEPFQRSQGSTGNFTLFTDFTDFKVSFIRFQF